MFTGLPRYELDRLQAVQNVAVRLSAGARKFDHVTPLLRERHWLPVEQCITFKMAVMTNKCVHGTTADYLADYIRPPSSATANLFCAQPVPVACLCQHYHRELGHLQKPKMFVGAREQGWGHGGQLPPSLVTPMASKRLVVYAAI